MADQSQSAKEREERLQLAIQDYQGAVFTSIQQAADAYDINHITLVKRLKG
jgi:hypothetical protein